MYKHFFQIKLTFIGILILPLRFLNEQNIISLILRAFRSLKKECLIY